jgi:hypothetical protein
VRDPDPCVFHPAYELFGLRIIVHIQEDAALVGEFERILKEVHDDL